MIVLISVEFMLVAADRTNRLSILPVHAVRGTRCGREMRVAAIVLLEHNKVAAKCAVETEWCYTPCSQQFQSKAGTAAGTAPAIPTKGRKLGRAITVSVVACMWA